MADNSKLEERDHKGRFVKGARGNPRGRPKGYAAFRDACRERADTALAALDKLVAEGGRDAGWAARCLLEFGFGKATHVVHDISDGPAGDKSVKQYLDELFKVEGQPSSSTDSNGISPTT